MNLAWCELQRRYIERKNKRSDELFGRLDEIRQSQDANFDATSNT